MTIAAESLVMAAWLLWLKARLLLPCEKQGEVVEFAASDLEARLCQLDIVKALTDYLVEQLRLGKKRLPRDLMDSFQSEPRHIPSALLAGSHRYSSPHCGNAVEQLYCIPDAGDLVHQAMARFHDLLYGPAWHSLENLLPHNLMDEFSQRTTLAPGLVAGLELARLGHADLLQHQPFDPILIRVRR